MGPQRKEYLAIMRARGMRLDQLAVSRDVEEMDHPARPRSLAPVIECGQSACVRYDVEVDCSRSCKRQACVLPSHRFNYRLDGMSTGNDIAKNPYRFIPNHLIPAADRMGMGRNETDVTRRSALSVSQ